MVSLLGRLQSRPIITVAIEIEQEELSNPAIDVRNDDSFATPQSRESLLACIGSARARR